jgi:hypothetical protein
MGQARRDNDDRPYGWGYQTDWAAIRADDPAVVAARLGLRDAHPCSLGAASRWHPRGGWLTRRPPSKIILTPAIRGWVLVPGGLAFVHEALPTPEHTAAMSARLGTETQAYMSDRSTGSFLWRRASGGRITRAYSVLEGDERENIGPPTSVELQLGCRPDGSFATGEFTDADDDLAVLLPEDFPLRVAGAWSVDPSTVPDGTPVGAPCWVGSADAGAFRG